MEQQERRRDRRLPVDLHLEISHMFRQNHEVIEGIDAEITVTDISRTGIGFVSSAKLPVDYYFNAKIKLDEKECFSSVVKILRQVGIEEKEYIYGAEFVGLAPFLADKITRYEDTINEQITMNYLNS